MNSFNFPNDPAQVGTDITPYSETDHLDVQGIDSFTQCLPAGREADTELAAPHH